MAEKKPKPPTVAQQIEQMGARLDGVARRLADIENERHRDQVSKATPQLQVPNCSKDHVTVVGEMYTLGFSPVSRVVKLSFGTASPDGSPTRARCR